jgi:Reverse transcriptase (RNA-dependent DNA polymerase)
LLSNIVLDEFDRELERRKLRFARYADDSNIYVRSRRAGERVMKSLVRFIATRLKLKVNEQKSAVAEPWERIRRLRRKLFGLPQLPVARQRSGVRERHAHGDWLCATARRAVANALTRQLTFGQSASNRGATQARIRLNESCFGSAAVRNVTRLTSRDSNFGSRE